MVTASNCAVTIWFYGLNPYDEKRRKNKSFEGSKTMANVIKISDDVYEEMRKNKPEDKSMQEYASEILKAGLQDQSLVTADESLQKPDEKDEMELKQKFDDMYEDINEILEKVSLNYDKLYGKNGTEEYLLQPEPVVRNTYQGIIRMTKEEEKKMLQELRKKPGIIPWDEFDRKMAQAQKEIEEEEKKKQEDKE